MNASYRSLPSVDEILNDDRVRTMCDDFSREAVRKVVRSELDLARDVIKKGEMAPTLDQIVEMIKRSADKRWRPWPKTVINATGVILHTNLGRAPLSTESTDAVLAAASGYSDIELDLKTGRRGSRQAHVNDLICEMTGAEAALVVNNNASAVMLGLAALASGREVLVSRGEAVEIGGGFRVPDVLLQSGASLIDVGTTNKTYRRDYENAVSANTGAVLAVHSSNFKMLGFTENVGIDDLVAVGTAHGIPVIHDLGSGCLLPTEEIGLSHEPMPQESVRAGVDLTFFSGDKLLGGPQSGIVVGKRGAIFALARHPLARAIRIDKLNMAGLAATLLHYVRNEHFQKIPVWRMLSTSIGDLEYRARKWQAEFWEFAEVVAGKSTVGGGSLPGETLNSRVLSIHGEKLYGGIRRLAERLRNNDPPLMGRIENERLLLDPRTVLPEQDTEVSAALRRSLGLKV